MNPSHNLMTYNSNKKCVDKDISPLTHEYIKKYISRLQFDQMIDDESTKYLKENSAVFL